MVVEAVYAAVAGFAVLGVGEDVGGADGAAVDHVGVGFWEVLYFLVVFLHGHQGVRRVCDCSLEIVVNQRKCE